MSVGGMLSAAGQDCLATATTSTSRLASSNSTQPNSLQKIASTATAAACFPSERGTSADFYREACTVTPHRYAAIWYIHETRNEFFAGR